MLVKIELVLSVGKQDSAKDAIDSAKNAMRGMDFEELIGVMNFEVISNQEKSNEKRNEE